MARLTQIFRRRERMENDEIFREKRKEVNRKSSLKNREKNRKYSLAYDKELSKFKNKRCKTCDILLHHRTKGDFCMKHKKIKLVKKKKT